MTDTAPEQIVRFRDGDHYWRVVAGERQALFSREQAGLIRQAPMTRLKQSRAKVVYRMKLPGENSARAIYLKSYLTRNYFWRPLKYLVRTSPAMEEWRLAQQLARRGVPIARHLAVGETRMCGLLLEATLVTEGLSGFETISDFLQKNYARISPRLRQQFARELGRFVRLLHDAGVLQVDLHPANILMRVTDDGAPEFRLVDLDGIVLRRRLGWRERLANLIELRVQLANRSSRADRLRFLRAYCGGNDARRLPQLAHRIEDVGARAVKFSRRDRARRCLKSNRDFGLVDGDGLRWQVRRDALDGKLESILDDPDGWLEKSETLLKDTASATVARVMRFIVKRANHKKPLSWIKDLFRPSRAKRAFLLAYHLELYGIPTPAAVACAERRTLGFLRHSYLVTMEVPMAFELGRYLKMNPTLPLAERRDLLRRLARLIASLHDAGFSHRDLKHTNILIGPPPQRALCLIDLDGLSDVGELSARRAMKDLARLDRAAREMLGSTARASERLRFFIEYRRALRDRRLKAALSK